MSKKIFIVDYVTPNGREDFKVVRAENEFDAVRVMCASGVDGWTGYKFTDYKIVKVSARV